jgi:hypothetical protein
LILTRPLTAAATAFAIFAAAFFSQDTSARAQGACGDAAEIAVLPSPTAPWKGVPLRVLFVAEKSLSGEFSLIAPDGSVAAKSSERHGGPPYFWFAEVASPAAGKWQAKLTREPASGDCAAITREIAVSDHAPRKPGMVSGSAWPLHNTWNRTTENFYSAWIEKLFDAPLDAAPSWPALHEVLRDRSRNFLFNHLGLGEDEMKLVIRPDCADLPYFLRAYFAYKMGLPFGYSDCSRGGGGKPPKCYQWYNVQKQRPVTPSPADAKLPANDAPPKQLGLAASFPKYLLTVANTVQSGTARAPAADNNTDSYPVPLTQDTLRPGTVYVDPFGHVLVLAKRIAQTPDAAGVIFAVDAQPDGTVARKRFWRGNFLFAQDPALGSPGWKRFRPIVADKSGGLHRLSNEEILKNPQYADFSLNQSKMSIEAFYDRMDDVMSPQPLDPERAMREAIASLEEQVKARVTSVENGRKFLNSAHNAATMPDGPAIFETTGAWEDFATPSRDLRLLIAIDVVRGYPDRVARRPERYAMPSEKHAADVVSDLRKVLASELSSRKFSYTRSDGSQWPLTLKDVLDRSVTLEMAYNLNDCVEHRWGAADKTDEAATCKRRAPEAQRAKMTKYREWFHERRRPPRA